MVDRLQVVTFPAPAWPWSINEERGKHYRWRVERVRLWRQAAAVAARMARVGARGETLVTVTLPVKGKVRKDPSNFLPAVKAVVDGFVDAGVWPDDTHEWVTVAEPVLDVRAKSIKRGFFIPGMVDVELRAVFSREPLSPPG